MSFHNPDKPVFSKFTICSSHHNLASFEVKSGKWQYPGQTGPVAGVLSGFFKNKFFFSPSL